MAGCTPSLCSRTFTVGSGIGIAPAFFEGTAGGGAAGGTRTTCWASSSCREELRVYVSHIVCTATKNCSGAHDDCRARLRKTRGPAIRRQETSGHFRLGIVPSATAFVLAKNYFAIQKEYLEIDLSIESALKFNSSSSLWLSFLLFESPHVDN